MEDFVEDIRKIMPPVCTVNERKFLDEMKEKAKPYISQDEIIGLTIPNYSTLFQSDFEINLSELVEGKQ
jgi:hypothetical protein